MKHLSKKRLMGWTVPCALPVVLALLACGFSTVSVTESAQASSCTLSCRAEYKSAVAVCLEKAEASDDSDCASSPTTCSTYTICATLAREKKTNCLSICEGGVLN